jgi:arabinofuranan 3-O-arabinosyltransferase
VAAVHEVLPTRGSLSRPTPAADTRGPSARTRALVGYVLLAALAYVPVLLTAPGKVAADTKQYFYLDPARLLSRAVSMWDPHTALGTVTHQNIGYLFPAGPYFWLTNELGIPAWIAQRLWLGSILFGAATGLLYLARTLSLRGPGIVIAALAYMLSPYSLQYASRLSTLLIAWAALPWMVALVARALRDGGWRYPAVFAIVVQLAGSVNATALIFAGIGPLLWIVYEVWIAREVKPREALATVARVGVLCIAASLWWISGLSVQAAYGLDELKYSETVRAVSTAGLAPEILRGLGYWFFYGGDKLAPWTDNVVDYTQRRWLLATSYAIPIGALLFAAFIRWKHRVYFALLILVGLTIAVGTHPYSSPSPFGAIVKAFSEGSTVGLALRSVGRAYPLIGLALALLLGIGINLVVQKLRAGGRGWLALGVAAAVGAVVIVNLPALWNGTFYGKNLTRPSTIPSYWTKAIGALDAGRHDTRILELPGSDFAAYRWGNTVEPITPGLTDRPYVARELIPYGSDQSADLLTAFDRRLQDGLLDPAAVAPIARLMNTGDVVLRSDLQVDRYDLARPQDTWQLFTPPPPGLQPATGFGHGLGPPLQLPLFDERSLAAPAGASDPPPVAVFPVTATRPIVRTESTQAPLVVSGNGEGLIDLASLGLLEGDPSVLYSASLAHQPARLQQAMNNGASLIVTDSNRRRAGYWNQTHNNVGFTEQAGARPTVKDPFDARLNVFPNAGSDAQTTMQQYGARVSASAYGNVTSLLPEDRPSRVLDGDLTTAWRVGGFSSVGGQWLQVDAPQPITTDRVNLVQPLTGLRNRYITQVKLSFDGGHAGKDVTLTLGPSSRTSDGQTLRFGRRTFRSLRITITGDNVGRRADYPNSSSVGFAEVRLRDEHASDDLRVDEVVQMPTDLVRRTGDRSAQQSLAYVMARQRTVLAPPHIAEEEPTLARSFTVPTGRDFTLAGVGRLSFTAPGPVIDNLLGIPGADAGGVTVRSSGALSTNLEARGSAALDGSEATAWTTPFDNPVGQWLDVMVPRPVTFDELGLVVVADRHHSVPTKLRIEAGGTTQIVDVPAIPDRPTADATVRVPVTFAPMTGSDVRVTIDAVRPATTTEYFSQTPRVLPAAIAELGIPGVTRPAPAPVLDSGCRTDLATLDGQPLPIRVSGDTRTASEHGALRLEACAGDPIHLSAGQHILRTAPGAGSGLDLDAIALASAAGGDATAPSPGGPVLPAASRTSAPRLHLEHFGATEVRATVDRATRPFWLVLGQSYSDGWKATVNGRDLGSPQVLDGFANAWLVRPDGRGTMTVNFTFTPQKPVWVASVVSGFALLLCAALALFARRRRHPELGDADAPRFRSWRAGFGPPARRGVVLILSLATALVVGVIVGPFEGLALGVVVAAALRWGRTHVVLAVGAPLLLAAAAGYILLQQTRHGYPPVFQWPTFFDRVHVVGWLAVVLLAADVVVEQVRGRVQASDGAARTPTTSHGGGPANHAGDRDRSGGRGT